MAAAGGRGEARVRGRGRLLVIKGEQVGSGVAWWWSCDGRVAREEDDKERGCCWAWTGFLGCKVGCGRKEIKREMGQKSSQAI